MERPLDIAFHNIDSSEALEAEIRKGVERLDQQFGGLVGCRVSVEALHKQHQTGNVYEVHIVLSVPGKDLAVSHAPHHAKDRYSNPDVYVSLREALRSAEKQLRAYKAKLRESPATPSGSALTGQVTLIEPGTDHGFILNSVGTQLYFHRDSVTNGRFEELKQGDLVHYVEEEGDAGPVATKIRVAASKAA